MSIFNEKTKVALIDQEKRLKFLNKFCQDQIIFQSNDVSTYNFKNFLQPKYVLENQKSKLSY
jgi:hypothetical protein